MWPGITIVQGAHARLARARGLCPGNLWHPRILIVVIILITTRIVVVVRFLPRVRRPRPEHVAHEREDRRALRVREALGALLDDHVQLHHGRGAQVDQLHLLGPGEAAGPPRGAAAAGAGTPARRRRRFALDAAGPELGGQARPERGRLGRVDVARAALAEVRRDLLLERVGLARVDLIADEAAVGLRFSRRGRGARLAGRLPLREEGEYLSWNGTGNARE